MTLKNHKTKVFVRAPMPRYHKLPLAASEKFSPNMVNLQINQKHMINATIFYKNMASKYMVRDSLLTVLCNGCVNSYTSLRTAALISLTNW